MYGYLDWVMAMSGPMYVHTYDLSDVRGKVRKVLGYLIFDFVVIKI